MKRHGELEWFFGGDMEAALGLRSNFAPLVDLAMSGLAGGGSRPAAEVSARRIDDATRARRIRGVLGQLPENVVRVLWALHAPMQFAAEVRRSLGELAAVVLLTPTGRRELARLSEQRAAKERERVPRDWLLSLVLAGGDPLEKLQHEADKMASAAMAAYQCFAREAHPPDEQPSRRRAAHDDVEPIVPTTAWRP